MWGTGLGVVLVPTLVRGVNTDSIGDIVRKALQLAPVVRGIHFQPVSYFGRFPGQTGDERRFTLPELMRSLEEQTGGLVKVADFSPPGCEHALCSFHATYLLSAEGSLRPIGAEKTDCCCPADIGAGGVRKTVEQCRAVGDCRPRRIFRSPAHGKTPCCGGPGSDITRIEVFSTWIFFSRRLPPGVLPYPPWPFRTRRTSTWNGSEAAAYRLFLRTACSSHSALKPYRQGRKESLSPTERIGVFMIATTPLEGWIRKKAGISPGLAGRSAAEALVDYQLRLVNETIDYARRNTPFYRRHLASFPAAPLGSLSDIARIPFTTPSDLAHDPFGFLAVHQADVARIVTLRTSASMGNAKRLFFTEEDLELTVDFFHHGMSTLVRPGQRVMVFLPGERADSVGDLLVRGLSRMDVRAFPYGPISDPVHAAQATASSAPIVSSAFPRRFLRWPVRPRGERSDWGA